MGLINSKEMMRRKIDEATSNSSLSNLRYIINSDKSKWKVFRKRDVAPIPAYPATFRPVKGCPCGNNGPCKQKITPRGVTIHYPQKKKKFGKFTGSRNYLPPKARTVINNNVRPIPKVKVIRQRKFPTWRLDKIYYCCDMNTFQKGAYSHLQDGNVAIPWVLQDFVGGDQLSAWTRTFVCTLP